MVVSSPQYGGHTTPFSSFSVDGLWLRYVIDYSFGISRNNASAISCGIALYYLFFASRLSFPQEYTVVIENKNFSEKFLFFSGLLLFVLRTELLLTMCPTWSAGVFFIYGHVLLSSVPDALPRIRAPPLTAPYSGQMPEASPGAALAVMRDAHVLNNSSTRLKRTFH